MGAKKVIRHMGMTMTEQEHRRWHQEHEGKSLTPEEHEKLMEHLGVSREQDRQWHKAQKTGEGESSPEPVPDGDPVNCLAIGGGFLEYCVRQGWLIRQRRGRATRYYVTEAGRGALAEFGITKY
jgi:hypothetical protein